VYNLKSEKEIKMSQVDSVKKIQLGPRDIFFPIPAALIVSGLIKKPNIITVAWIGIMGSDPPILGMSLKSNRYSLEHIKRAKEFTVNISSADNFREVDYCGMVSGREKNKFEDIHFTPMPSNKVVPPIISECPFNLECKVVNETCFGDWVVIFGEIVETHVDEDKYDKEENQIIIEKINPLIYCATVREYWQLGKKLGKGFNAGKDYLKK
jgi:flavin reductase (DIM6/NTAB) family NADH-FMN oxidoreductase RutF